MTDTVDPGRRRHVVVLVHGIRTFGAWQDRLAALLHRHASAVEVHVYKYGYFSSLAFLLPFVRILVVRRFRRYLARNAEAWRDARVDIVAHSFGTHVAAWALRGLRADRRPSIHTMLLCGSVLKQLFPWDTLIGPGMPVGQVINECGQRDVWPVIAQMFVFGMGVAGRRGFAGVTGPDVGLVNRYFAVGHGGFFTDEFMERQWVPILTSDAFAAGAETLSPTPGWGAALEYYADPVKLLVLLLPVFAVVYGWQVQRTQVAEARANMAQADLARMKAEEGRKLAEQERQAAEARRAEQEALRLVAEANRILLSNPSQGLQLAAQALTVKPPVPNASDAGLAAIRAALEVIRKRQDVLVPAKWGTSLFTSYIAPAWFEGDFPARYSRDGKRVLLMTERGRSDNNPPGEAYLLDTQSLELIHLDKGPAWGTRREGPGTIVELRVKPDAPEADVGFVLALPPWKEGWTASGVSSVLRVGSSPQSRPPANVTIANTDANGRRSWTVNGQPIGREVPLRRGDTLVVTDDTGEHEFTFLDKEQAEAVFDLSAPSLSFRIPPHIDPRRPPKLPGDFKRRLEFVGFGERDKRIYLARQYNIEVYRPDGVLERTFSAACTKYPISLVTSVLNDSLIVYGDTDGGIYTLDRNTSRCTSVTRRPGRILVRLELSPSGRVAGLLHTDGTMAIWWLDALEARDSLLYLPIDRIIAAEFRPIGGDDILLTATKDGQLALWAVANRQALPVRPASRVGDSVRFAGFTEAGKTVVTVADDGVRIWDAGTGRRVWPAPSAVR